MLGSLLLLTLLAGNPPDPAAPAQMVNIKGWDAAQYNDALVDDLYGGFLQLQQNILAVGALQDQASFDAGLLQLQADAQAALTRISLYPAYKGDTGLRDAIGSSFLWARQQTVSTLPELFALYQAPEVHNADLARAETLVTTLIVSGKAQDENVMAKQREFAKKNGYILVVPDETPFPALPSFTAPGIPPEGSVLSGQVHMSFVLRYHNALSDRQTQMVGEVNTFFDATHGDLGQLAGARERALAAVRGHLVVFRATEDWQGDAGLRDALVRLGEDLEKALSGPFAEYVGLVSKVSLSKKEANKANELAGQGNADVQAAFDRFNPLYDAFRVRWHFAEYEAWAAAQPQ